jgi:hypothetical protein
VASHPYRVLWMNWTTDVFFNRIHNSPNTINIGDETVKGYGNCTWRAVLDWEANLTACRRRSTKTLDACGFVPAEAPLVLITCPPASLVTDVEQGYFARIKTKLTLFFGGDANWGFLSTFFPNASARWAILENVFRRQLCRNVTRAGRRQKIRRPWCELSDLMKIFDDRRVTAVFTIQHHNLTHPKVHMFPQGAATSPYDWNRYYHNITLFDPLWERPFFVLNSNDGRNTTGRPLVNRVLFERLGLVNDYRRESGWARRIGRYRL